MSAKERYNLRTWSIGVDVPFYDLQDKTGYQELSSNLSNRYLDWFDVIDVGIKIVQLPGGNNLVLYTIVVRIDNYATSDNTMESDWESMKEEVKADLTEFMNSRGYTEYRFLV